MDVDIWYPGDTMLPILAEFNELRENRSLDSRSYSCVMVHVGRDGRTLFSTADETF